MQRVLVIQDVGLWLDLNRHLSGVASVDLVEALSLESGQILAQLERPEIVVCDAQSDPDAPGDLYRQLRSSQSVDEGTATHVIAVEPRPTGVDSHVLPAGPIRCGRDELLPLVTRLLSGFEDKSEPGLELLAHYEIGDGSDAAGAAASMEPTGFAVVIELTERRLVIESDQPLKQDTELDVTFFLSDPLSGAKREKVALHCVIAQCRDEEKLVYSARISKIGDGSRQLIQRVTAGAASPGARR